MGTESAVDSTYIYFEKVATGAKSPFIFLQRIDSKKFPLKCYLFLCWIENKILGPEHDRNFVFIAEVINPEKLSFQQILARTVCCYE